MRHALANHNRHTLTSPLRPIRMQGIHSLFKRIPCRECQTQTILPDVALHRTASSSGIGWAGSCPSPCRAFRTHLGSRVSPEGDFRSSVRAQKNPADATAPARLLAKAAGELQAHPPRRNLDCTNRTGIQIFRPHNRHDPHHPHLIDAPPPTHDTKLTYLSMRWRATSSRFL